MSQVAAPALETPPTIDSTTQTAASQARHDLMLRCLLDVSVIFEIQPAPLRLLRDGTDDDISGTDME
ncbi:MAG TPA: hypothetical protein VF920_09620 [Dongiaceae bacterium]